MICFLSALSVRVYPFGDPAKSLGCWMSSPPQPSLNDTCPQPRGATNSKLHSLCSDSVCNWQILTLRGKCTRCQNPLPGLSAVLSKDLIWTGSVFSSRSWFEGLRQAGSLFQEIKLSPDFFLVIFFEPEMAEAVPSGETHTTENFPVVEADSEFLNTETGSMNRTLPTRNEARQQILELQQLRAEEIYHYHTCKCHVRKGVASYAS